MGICMACKAKLPLWAHFCGQCGAPLEPLTPTNAQAQSNEPHLMTDIPINKNATGATTPQKHSKMPLPITGPYAPRAWGALSFSSHKIQPKGRRVLAKWVIILLISAVIAAAGASGLLIYLLTRPQPALSLITSTYNVGSIPAGSNGTTLRMHGQNFSDNSAVTFFLDNRPVANAPTVVSDHFGAFNATLPITATWPLGLHTLTATDTDHYTSKKGIQIEIVAQGEAHTPGPNGAPSNDASFKMQLSVQAQNHENSAAALHMDTLLVSGNPDPVGGSVCRDRDNMQPQTYNSSTTSGLPETTVYTFSCAGSYKNGQISYTETLLSATITVSNQGNIYACRLLTGGVDEQLSGRYTTRGNFSGTVTLSAFPASDFSCTTGQLSYFNFSLLGGSGTWSATYALDP